MSAFPSTQDPGAHGQAALLLAESLLHAFVEKAVLTNAEAIEVVERAAGVEREVAAALGESGAKMQASLHLLSRIASSLRADAA